MIFKNTMYIWKSYVIHTEKILIRIIIKPEVDIQNTTENINRFLFSLSR